MAILFVVSYVVLSVCLVFHYLITQQPKSITPISVTSITPISVNYHFTRKCNYKCGYCFHTAKNGFELPLDEATRGMGLLKDAGLQKINFSGGEPFMIRKGRHLGDLCRIAKRDLGIKSVSIVSNASLITEEWFQRYGEFVDILAVSCDSFDDETNRMIGRCATGQRDTHVEAVRRVAKWCREYRVAFKLNTVISKMNVQEDFTSAIEELKPTRWKVFQCLPLEGENMGESALRDARPFLITDDQYRDFLNRHRHLECLVEESNEKMRDSYLILDERMQFLDCSKGGKTASKSILEVGVEKALKASGFDEDMFHKRGAVYNWNPRDTSSASELF